MSNTINNGSLTSNGANAVSAPATASIVLPANCLCILDVLNRHSTAGSLSAAPTISSTGGETWHLLTSLTTGAASPNVRVSRYYTMVSTATTTIVTMTFSVAQTNILWDVNWVSGCKTSGVDGADAIGQVVTSAPATAGTSCAISISAFANPRNALFAAYAAANSTGLTPQTGWTESADHTAASCELQEQFTLSYDTQANVGTGGLSLLLAGIATEIVAASSTINVQTIVNTTIVLSAGTGGSVPFSVVAGRQYFFNLNFGVNSGVENVGLTVKGGVLTFTVDASITVINAFAGRHRFGRFAVPTFTGPVTLKLDNPASAGNASGQLAIIEVSGFDATVGGGTGIYQTVSSGASGVTPGPISISIGVLTSRNNPILLLGSDIGNFPIAGYQIESAAITSGAVGPYTQWRGNGDPLPHFGGGPGNSVAAVVYEMAAAAGFNAPIVTLVSPTNGSTIANNATITIDVTDLDGDLSTVNIVANGETVTATGTTLPSPFTGGSISTITNGKRFAFSRTGNWTGSTLGVTVVAVDAQGHTTSTSFAFPVAFNDFSIACSPTSKTINLSSSDTIAITTALVSGSAETVTFSATGLPTGVTAGFSPTSATAGSGSTLTLTVGGGVAPATYTLTVTGTAASATHSATITLTVPAATTHAPVITRITPALGSISPTQVITLTVTDQDNDLSLTTITATFPTLGTVESVLTATSALVLTSGSYSALTTAVPILTTPKGYTFGIARTGGWPDAAAVTITVTATDGAGNVTTQSFTFSPVVIPAPPTPPTVVTATSGTKTQRGRDILIDPVTNNFALTKTGDLSLTGFDAAGIAQACRQAIRTFLGEWFLDTDRKVGVDWFGQVLIKNPNLTAVRAVLRAVLVGVAGVKDIVSIDLSLNSKARSLTVTFAVSSDLGELVVDSTTVK